MTEQERIDRERLLKRAASAAGAVYLAPAFISVAGAAVQRPRKCAPGRTCERSQDCRNSNREPCLCCPEDTKLRFTCRKAIHHCQGCAAQRCVPGTRGDEKCRNAGGPGCKCINGKCELLCTQDSQCPPSDGQPCRALQPCGRDGTCACFLCAPNRDANNCVVFRSSFCADYPPCSKEDGSGCPPGHNCYDTCCPGGICEIDCTNAAAPRIACSVGTGPTLTLP